MHLRLACRMNVKNETARILRAHAERAASENALVKIYFKLYKLKIAIYFYIKQVNLTIMHVFLKIKQVTIKQGDYMLHFEN